MQFAYLPSKCQKPKKIGLEFEYLPVIRCLKQQGDFKRLY